MSRQTNDATTEEADAPPAAIGSDIVEVIPARQPEAHGFHFKVRANGQIYRLEPARDPQLPRFWCFSVSRCTASGTVDPAENPWFGGDRMTREELPAAVAEIRAGLGDWLALPQHAELKTWILENRPVEALSPNLAPAGSRRTASG